MSTHKHIDRICCLAVVVALLISVVFLNADVLGITEAARAMGYESRLFDTSSVHTIEITMEDWDSFIDTCEDEEYAACTVTIDGESYKNIGIRAKGNTSLSSVSQSGSDRYSFKLEFDQYDSTLSYHGLDKLSLNNLIQDNTMMKDYLTYQMMNQFGVDAPLSSFVYITVNGEEWGLYLAVEGVEDSFLQRNYGTEYGELYKPDSLSNMGGGGGMPDMGEMPEDFEFPDMGEMPEGFEFPDMGEMSGDFPFPGMEAGTVPEETGETTEGASAAEETEATEPSGDVTMPDMGEMPEGMTMPENGEMPEGMTMPDMGEIPEGMTMPEMGEMPEGMTMPENGEMPEGMTAPEGETTAAPEAAEETEDAAEADENSEASDESATEEGFTFPGFGGEMPDMGQMPDMGDMGGFGGMGSSDVKLQYIDDDPESYSNIFGNAKTDVTEADQQRLIESLKSLTDGENIYEVVDVEEVLRYFVVHNFVVNGDSYTGSMIHNYYLYEENGQLSMIPWDYNLAFGTFQGSDAQSSVNEPIDDVLDDRPMQSWIFSSEEYTAMYHQYYAEFLETVDIAGIIQDAYELIAPYVESDPTKFCTYEEFESGVEALQTFCTLRSQSVSGQLDGTIPATSEEQSGSDALVETGDLNLSDMGSMGGMGGGDMGGGGRGGMGGGFMPFGQNETEDTDQSQEVPEAAQTPENAEAAESSAEENQMPQQGEMPDMSGMPTDGTMPDMSGMPTDGAMPDMSGMPTDGTMPDMNVMPQTEGESGDVTATGMPQNGQMPQMPQSGMFPGGGNMGFGGQMQPAEEMQSGDVVETLSEETETSMTEPQTAEETAPAEQNAGQENTQFPGFPGEGEDFSQMQPGERGDFTMPGTEQTNAAVSTETLIELAVCGGILLLAILFALVYRRRK